MTYLVSLGIFLAVLLVVADFPVLVVAANVVQGRRMAGTLGVAADEGSPHPVARDQSSSWSLLHFNTEWVGGGTGLTEPRGARPDRRLGTSAGWPAGEFPYHLSRQPRLILP